MMDTSVMQERIGQLCHQFKLPTIVTQSVARFTAAGHGDALSTFLEVLEQEADDRRHHHRRSCGPAPSAGGNRSIPLRAGLGEFARTVQTNIKGNGSVTIPTLSNVRQTFPSPDASHSSNVAGANVGWPSTARKDGLTTPAAGASRDTGRQLTGIKKRNTADGERPEL